MFSCELAWEILSQQMRCPQTRTLYNIPTPGTMRSEKRDTVHPNWLESGDVTDPHEDLQVVSGTMKLEVVRRGELKFQRGMATGSTIYSNLTSEGGSTAEPLRVHHTPDDESPLV
jgi:hypothetical protein